MKLLLPSPIKLKQVIDLYKFITNIGGKYYE